MRGRRPGKTGGVFAGIHGGFFRAEHDADGRGSYAAVERSMSDRLLARRISSLLSFSFSQLIHITVCILLLFRALSMIATTVHWEASHGLTSDVRSSISITDLVTQRLTRIELASL
jgi:hypothetical protein